MYMQNFNLLIERYCGEVSHSHDYAGGDIKISFMTDNLNLQQHMQEQFELNQSSEEMGPEQHIRKLCVVECNNAHIMLEARKLLGSKSSVGRLYSLDEKVIIYAQGDERLIVIHSCSEDLYHEELRRVIRAIYKSLLILNGWMYCHGAAFLLNNVGVCITGNKRSGKTSTLLSMIDEYGSQIQYCSNDKLMLKKDERTGRLRMLGLPHKISIRMDVLQQFEGLHRMKNNPSFYVKENRRVLENIKTNEWTEDKFQMLPVEMSRVLKIALKQIIEPQILIIPNWNTENQQARLERIDSFDYDSYKLQMLDLDKEIYNVLRKEFSKVQNDKFSEIIKKIPNVFYLHQNFKTIKQATKLVYNLTEKLKCT